MVTHMESIHVRDDKRTTNEHLETLGGERQSPEPTDESTRNGQFSLTISLHLNLVTIITSLLINSRNWKK